MATSLWHLVVNVHAQFPLLIAGQGSRPNHNLVLCLFFALPRSLAPKRRHTKAIYDSMSISVWGKEKTWLVNASDIHEGQTAICSDRCYSLLHVGRGRRPWGLHLVLAAGMPTWKKQSEAFRQAIKQAPRHLPLSCWHMEQLNYRVCYVAVGWELFGVTRSGGTKC